MYAETARVGGFNAHELVMQLAAEQHGAVSVALMRECGLSWKAQKTALAKGQLRLIEPTVAIVVGSPDTWHRRLQIGLLALGPEAWVSHEAAATLLGFDKCLVAPVSFAKPRRVRTTTSVGKVHTTAFVGDLDLITVAGFRCASATRTILDLAYLGIPPNRLAAAIDSAVRSGPRGIGSSAAARVRLGARARRPTPQRADRSGSQGLRVHPGPCRRPPGVGGGHHAHPTAGRRLDRMMTVHVR